MVLTAGNALSSGSWPGLSRPPTRPDIRDAIQREHTMKHWSRAWKVRVILDMNPTWDDPFETLNA